MLLRPWRSSLTKRCCQPSGDSRRWRHSQSDTQSVIEVKNPATGDVLATLSAATPKQVEDTVLAAHNVFSDGVWSKSLPLARSKILSNLARLLEVKLPELAELETRQTGRTIREMRTQLGRLPEWLDYFAALLRVNQSFVAPTQGKLLNYVERIPLGVVAQITPFNHPLLIAIKKIAPALAAGNSVVVKPSELAPLSVLRFVELAKEAGVPEHVLSVLVGYGHTTGVELVKNKLIRKVDVTAGTSTGRALGRIVGENLAAFTAELGGKAPIIVFEDADIHSAVNGVAFASFVASGQTCVSGTRIIVHEQVYDEFMALFLEKVESIQRRMGNPMNPQSTMGTIISERHLERIESMLHRTSGHIITGGQRLQGRSKLDGFDFSQGSFFPPTVITDIDVTDELWEEEIFGPVVVIKKFTAEAEGVALANNCKYGLGGAVWTTDLSRAHRVASQLQVGLCWVNTHHRNDPSSPWGGLKESGIGRENGIEAYHAYTQSKSTIVNTAPAMESRESDDWFGEGGTNARYG